MNDAWSEKTLTLDFSLWEKILPSANATKKNTPEENFLNKKTDHPETFFYNEQHQL